MMIDFQKLRKDMPGLSVVFSSIVTVFGVLFVLGLLWNRASNQGAQCEDYCIGHIRNMSQAEYMNCLNRCDTGPDGDWHGEYGEDYE